MPLIPIIPTFLAFGGGHPINWARNGVGPPATGLRVAGDFLNCLLARRTKQLFAKEAAISALATSASDITTWRFGCHTSPIARFIIAEFILVPASSPSNANPSRAWWKADTGLTGADPTTAFASVYLADVSTGSTVPNDFHRALQVLPVDPDTDYRFALHLENGMRVLATSVFEVGRLTVDPDTDTPAVDTTRFTFGRAIHDIMPSDLFAAGEKVWKRLGAPYFGWSASGVTAIQRVTNTGANLLDQTVVARSATSPGFPIKPQYRGSLDSNNAPAKFYAYAGISSGVGPAKIDFVTSAGTIASINVTGTNQWWETTGNVDGSAADEKIDVFITGDGASTLSVFACGAFPHIA